MGRRIIFTGPDGIKDYKAKCPANTTYTGEKRPVLGATSDLNYLWRAAPKRSFAPIQKHFYVHEIGWGIPELSCINQSRLTTGVNIKRGEFRKRVEEIISHRYQNPWYPKPQILDLQGPGSRANLSWNIGDHENITERNSKWATVVRNLKNAPVRFPACPKLPKVTEKSSSEVLDVSSRSQMSFDQDSLEEKRVSLPALEADSPGANQDCTNFSGLPSHNTYS